MSLRLPIAALVAALAVPAFAAPDQATPPAAAQTKELPQDRGYDKHSATHDAVDASEKPVTKALNREADISATTGTAAVETANANRDAQYAADMAQYRLSYEAAVRTAMADEARYDRQQRAYADAMATWRMNVQACDRGRLSACKRPTPNPADFY